MKRIFTSHENSRDLVTFINVDIVESQDGCIAMLFWVNNFFIYILLHYYILIFLSD